MWFIGTDWFLGNIIHPSQHRSEVWQHLFNCTPHMFHLEKRERAPRGAYLYIRLNTMSVDVDLAFVLPSYKQIQPGREKAQSLPRSHCRGFPRRWCLPSQNWENLPYICSKAAGFSPATSHCWGSNALDFHLPWELTGDPWTPSSCLPPSRLLGALCRYDCTPFSLPPSQPRAERVWKISQLWLRNWTPQSIISCIFQVLTLMW